MNLISKIILAITLLLSITIAHAQIKNATTETVKVYGNCGMCQKTIEKAGSLKNIAKVNWNIDTNMATLTYDAKITNQDEILKRIALAGYDSEKFLAPDDVYSNLHGCCQYDRVAKVAVNTESVAENHANHSDMTQTEMQQPNQLTAVFDTYFAVKDALVKTDGATASTKATQLLSAVNAVKMDKLEMDVHMVWMKVLSDLKSDSENISKSNDIAKQRKQFMSLSNNIYALLKVSKTETPTYYQFCPMANGGKGANWLSKENAIKNPYYGSQMMTCGKTVETIK
jgi:copper chaperone CopZ